MMCRRWAGTRRLRSGGSQPPSPATREIMMGVGDGVASVIMLCKGYIYVNIHHIFFYIEDDKIFV